MKALLRLSQAKIDVAEITEKLAKQDPERGFRFVDAVEESLKRLQRPSRNREPVLYGSRKRKLAGFRFWPVKGFRKYFIFYRVKGDRIQVARVLHGFRYLDRLLES